MKASTKILEWADNCQELSTQMDCLEDKITELSKHTYPLPDTLQLRGLAGSNEKALQTIEAWEKLMYVWESCSETDISLRFQALFRELETGAYPEFFKQRIAKHAAVALNHEGIQQLYDTAKSFEPRSADLILAGYQLGVELTEHVSGNMVFTLTAEAKPDFKRTEISGYIPLTVLNYSAKITAFPQQSMYDIARRWLAAASRTGFDSFELIGYNEYDFKNPKRAVGDLQEGMSVNAQDLEGVTSLWLLLSSANESKSVLRNDKKIRIDFDKLNGINCLSIDLLFNREPLGTNRELYLHKIGKILDAVVESYRI